MSNIAYKGTDKNMRCRGLQYQLNEKVESGGAVRCADKGFHSCEFPLDVFSYYPPAEGTRLFEVKFGGQVDRDESDSKIASAELTLKVELDLPQFTKKATEYVMARVKKSGAKHSKKDFSHASNTGDQSAASVEGKSSVAICTGSASKIKASKGSAAILIHRNDEGEILKVVSGIAGVDIAPDVWYRLDDSGDFEKVEG